MRRLAPWGFILLFFCPPLAAHDGLHRESLRALLKADGLHLVMLWSREAGDRARLERERADLNKDGHLDRGEREAWLTGLEGSLLKRLRLVFDGADLAPAIEARSVTGLLGPSRSVEGISASVQLRWAFVEADTHELRLSLRPTNLAAHVHLSLQLARDLRVLEHSGLMAEQAGRAVIRDLLGASRELRLRFVLAPQKAPEKSP